MLPVSRKELRHSAGSLLVGLAWPFVLGLALACGFYYLVFWGPLAHPLANRYFAGHSINMVETALFFVGLVALLQKLWNLFGQQSALASELLPDKTLGHPVGKASEWLDSLT